jgi:NADH-quinone oxidoreductase subunit L
MRKMGGLRHDLPLAFWGFLIGAASLSALPLVTAGFYSKEIILEYTLRSTDGSLWMWLAGAAGAALTALYSFRAVMLVFYGSRVTAPRERPGLVMNAPVVVLSVLAAIGGLLWWPLGYGVHIDTFARFMERAVPVTPTSSAGFGGSPVSHYITEVFVLIAIVAAWRIWSVRRLPQRANALSRFLLAGWGFDWLYDRLIVWPLAAFARWSRNDPFDLFFTALARLTMAAYATLSRTQNGRVRAYAASVALGAAIVVALAVFVR